MAHLQSYKTFRITHPTLSQCFNVTGCSVSVRTGTGSELKLRDVIYIMGCKREACGQDGRMIKLVVVLVDTV